MLIKEYLKELKYPLIFYKSYSFDQIKALAEILKEFEKIDIITDKYKMLQVSLAKIPPNTVIIDPIADDRITDVYYCSSDGYTLESKSAETGQFFIIEKKCELTFTLILRNLY